MKKYKPNWPVKRRKQLQELTRLLYDVSHLNSSTNILGNLDKVMRQAKKLTESNLGGTASFTQFLEDTCYTEKKPAKTPAQDAKRLIKKHGSLGIDAIRELRVIHPELSLSDAHDLIKPLK